MWVAHPPQTLYILKQSRALISTVPSVPQATTKKPGEGKSYYGAWLFNGHIYHIYWTWINLSILIIDLLIFDSTHNVTPQWKLSESKSERFRIPPTKKKENCQSPSPRGIEYPPKWKLSESKSGRFRIPPQIKIVRESKSERFRIPPPNENCQRVQIREVKNTREIYVETNL